MRFAISGDAEESCEEFCDCEAPDRFEIAESIEDVRGAARPMSTLCCGAVAAIGRRVPVGELGEVGEVLDDFAAKTESETLREEPYTSCKGRPYLPVGVSYRQPKPVMK